MKESLQPKPSKIEKGQDQSQSLRSKSQPDNSNIDRRTFMKIAGAGLTFGSLTVLARQLGFRPKELFNNKPEIDWFQQELSSIKQKTIRKTTPPTPSSSNTSHSPSPTPDRIENLVTPTPEKEPQNPFIFHNINFSTPDQPINMRITTNSQDKIPVPAFHPHGWTPKEDKKNIFNPRNNTSIAWIDQNDRIGLWLHSGRLSSVHSGFTMWNTQEYLEVKNTQGHRRSPQELQQLLENQIISARVYIKQNNNFTLSKITAAVRIPPYHVKESTHHVMDMVSWLADKHPDSGFKSIIDKHQVLLPKFCGRHLAGETPNPNLPSYQQSRFVFALEKA